MAITIKLNLIRNKDFKSGYDVEINSHCTKIFFYSPKEKIWQELKKNLVL